MRASSIVAASVALVAGANAHYSYDNVTYTTQVVTAYTVVCPTPTEIVHGTQTYTVTEVSKLHFPTRLNPNRSLKRIARVMPRCKEIVKYQEDYYKS